MVAMTYRDALRKALDDAMAEDNTIVVIGEEVGRYGGAYGVTKDLIGKYGADRLIDTPISEPAIIGAAVGAAMTGLRPVAELMYIDFLGMTMDQLANQAAKIRYMFGGQIGVPMVLRTQGGTGRSAGAQHSQSLEAWIMHTPGLRLAMPATVQDAYHLLRQSLTKPDPVVFIEHKALYTRKEEVDLDAEPLEWGKAAVRRTGKDLVIVTYSRQLHYAMDAAEKLASKGIEATVIDLRTLNPLDFDTVREHVERVGKAMVVSEGVMTAGVAAELSARITEECFDYLEQPVVRVAGEDIPISVSQDLEAGSVPTADLIRSVAENAVMTERILKMPRLGETMEEGKIVGFLVNPGDSFKRGDSIIEIETDKTVAEFPALGDGTLHEWIGSVGDHVVVGAPLARIDIGVGPDWTDEGGESTPVSEESTDDFVVTELDMPRLGKRWKRGALSVG